MEPLSTPPFSARDIKTIPVSKLRTSSFNPDVRTQHKALVALLNDIRERGVLSPIHVIKDGDAYLVVDGHRRLAVASMLKKESLIAVVHEKEIGEAASLWASLNSKTRSVKSYEWMVMWLYSGVDDKCLPPKIMSDIRACMSIFGGKDGLRELINRRVSPSIAVNIENVHRALFSKKVGAVPSKKDIGLWMIKNKGVTNQCHAVISRNPGIGALRKIASCIRGGRPFNVVDLASRTPLAEEGS